MMNLKAIFSHMFLIDLHNMILFSAECKLCHASKAALFFKLIGLPVH